MTENLTEKTALLGIVTVFVWHGIILFLLAEPKFPRKKCAAIVGVCSVCAAIGL